MPWKPSDATEHTHEADTQKKQERWAAVANNALRRGLSEASAIRMANSAVKGPTSTNG